MKQVIRIKPSPDADPESRVLSTPTPYAIHLIASWGVEDPPNIRDMAKADPAEVLAWQLYMDAFLAACVTNSEPRDAVGRPARVWTIESVLDAIEPEDYLDAMEAAGQLYRDYLGRVYAATAKLPRRPTRAPGAAKPKRKTPADGASPSPEASPPTD
jgi:hypothetical protein